MSKFQYDLKLLQYLNIADCRTTNLANISKGTNITFKFETNSYIIYVDIEFISQQILSRPHVLCVPQGYSDPLQLAPCGKILSAPF